VEATLNAGWPEFGRLAMGRITETAAKIVILETMGSGGTCIKSAELVRAACPQVPIVCILTSVTSEDRQFAKRISNAYVLQKPFHAEDLCQTIIEVMGSQDLVNLMGSVPQPVRVVARDDAPRRYST
jgi:DNA-binding response OmpR family regulator